MESHKCKFYTVKMATPKGARGRKWDSNDACIHVCKVGWNIDSSIYKRGVYTKLTFWNCEFYGGIFLSRGLHRLVTTWWSYQILSDLEVNYGNRDDRRKIFNGQKFLTIDTITVYYRIRSYSNVTKRIILHLILLRNVTEHCLRT